MVSYIDIMAKDAKDVSKITSTSSNPIVSENETTCAVTLSKSMAKLPTNKVLLRGISVKRLTSRGKWKTRMITLSSDKQAFFITHSALPTGFSSQLASTLPIPFYTPSKGFVFSNDSERYVRHIDVADIDGWQVGVIGVQKLEFVKNSLSESDIQNLVTIFHHGYKSMCFMISSNHRHCFVDAIEKMKARYTLMSSWINNDQLLLRYIYYDIDRDKSGTIDFGEFREICKRINFTPPSNLKATYKKFAEGRKEISIATAKELLRTVSTEGKVMPADKLWDDIFGKDVDTVSPKRFLKEFLHNCQGETAATEEDSKRFVESMQSLGNSKSSDMIIKEDFVHFLHSKYNDAYDPALMKPLPETTKLDMPLSKYWINTSHNTYLMGDQLKSRSSVEAYERALIRGCKCLEFDCWDGDTQECIPVIFHGHTLTSKMTFRSACLVTNNYLVANPTTYPIILSLENHCTLPFQKVMAKDMNEIFGDRLFIPTEEQCTGDDLPSPEELRGMVVIKGKRPPEPDEGASQATFEDLELDYDDGYNSDDPESVRSPRSVNQIDSGKVDSFSPKSSSNGAERKKKVQSDLRKVTLLHGAKYKEFAQSIAQYPTTMHSIGETKITKLVSKVTGNGDLWREYNENHMTRTYPAGTRVDSSNYNPVLAWAMGCQLVALNFQTPDSNLALNDGLFRQAGKCGYIPKPPSLMGGAKPDKKKVKIRVLSARCLPKPRGAKRGELVDPYIQIDLHDVRVNDSGIEEHVKESYKTSTVDNNGFCPTWKDGAYAEFEVQNSDVAIFHFRIIDDDLGSDDKIASSAIPLLCLRKGYRCVQLYDDNDTKTGAFESSTLFVKIEY